MLYTNVIKVIHRMFIDCMIGKSIAEGSAIRRYYLSNSNASSLEGSPHQTRARTDLQHQIMAAARHFSGIKAPLDRGNVIVLQLPHFMNVGVCTVQVHLSSDCDLIGDRHQSLVRSNSLSTPFTNRLHLCRQIL